MDRFDLVSNYLVASRPRTHWADNGVVSSHTCYQIINFITMFVFPSSVELFCDSQDLWLTVRIWVLPLVCITCPKFSTGVTFTCIVCLWICSHQRAILSGITTHNATRALLYSHVVLGSCQQQQSVIHWTVTCIWGESTGLLPLPFIFPISQSVAPHYILFWKTNDN